MQHPDLRTHPHQSLIYVTLVDIYYAIDAFGFEDEIYSALDTIENDIPLDRYAHNHVFYLRAAMADVNEDWNIAYKLTLDYIQRVEQDSDFQRGGYALKAEIHFARGELAYALEAEILCEQAARRARMWVSAAEAVMWQGVFTQYAGDTAGAAALYERGVLEFDSLNAKRDATFYLIASDYHAACHKLDEAFAMREKQLQFVQESGSVDHLFYCRLYRCYLLNQMQKPLGDEKFIRSKHLLENMQQGDLVPSLAVGYFMGCGRDAEAVEHSQQALEVARLSGSLDRTLEWHIARGYLLNRLNRPIADEMAHARELLPLFRTPDCHLRKIERVEQGRCYPYDWQIAERRG